MDLNLKKIIGLLCLFVSQSYAQNLNQYQYAIVPSKFSYFKEPNEYNLNVLTKLLMGKYGFESYFDNEILPDAVANNTQNKVFVDVVINANLFASKVKIVLKNSKNEILFTSEEGKSKDKDIRASFNEALREAFSSFDVLQHKYTETKGNQPSKITSAIAEETTLYAQPIPNGFQLVDAQPKVVMTLYKVSSETTYIALKDSIQGVLLLKNNQWFFEYYQNNQLISLPIKVKF